MSVTVFVFGSNLAGRHGKGAALHALQFHGAKYGHGWGWGQDMDTWASSYAIPTKDQYLRTLPLSKIKDWVDTFLIHARSHPDLTFFVTRVGCGLAANTEVHDASVAPLFQPALSNCLYPPEWRIWLGPNANYHTGTCPCSTSESS